MEQTTLYLLCSLIEMPEGSSTDHALYASREMAKQALEPEILSCAENFNFEDGKIENDFGDHYEWRNQDGYGFEVWIEEITPIK